MSSLHIVAAIVIPEPGDEFPEVTMRQWVNSIAVAEPDPLSILFNRITWVPVCYSDGMTRIIAWIRRLIHNAWGKRGGPAHSPFKSWERPLRHA